MKKSLSVILSSAMALSMFSSVAFGKTSADFTDLKDLPADQKAIFDAMISAGIFDGVTDTTFGLNDDMNRAQFAKIAAKILGLDATGTTSTFTDVKATDAANGYAVGAIEALKKAGVTDGVTDTTFDPAGKVTKEQLAAFLIRAMGKDAEAKLTPGVTDATVSTWAKGYVAFALNAKLVTNGADGTFGGTTNASRSLLVLSSSAAKTAIEATKIASVTEAKATGVQTVTVTLNKAVDTAKATLSLKKGSADVATTTKFSDDKKTATLTLTNAKVGAGEYTVTLGGLDAAAIGTATAKFTAEDEVVKKIDFVTPSDTIASSKKVKLEIKAANQYGENASYPAGNYTVYATTPTTPIIQKDDSGKLFVVLNTKADGSTLIQNVSQISVNIYNNDSHVTASKTFKLGAAPYVSKVELGTPVYSNGKGYLANSGDKVVIPMTQIDQYGGVITTDSEALVNANVNVTPYYSKLTTQVIDDNNDGVTEVVANLTGDADVNGDYTINVFGGTSVTAKIAVKSVNAPAKVSIDSSATLAVGDVDKYIKLTAYDKDGNVLSADDLVTSINNGSTIINVSGNLTTGATTGVPVSMLTTDTGKNTVVTAGEHKGEIHVASVTSKGTANIFVGIYAKDANGTNFTTSANIGISDSRYPVSLKASTDNSKKALVGATSDLVLKVYDQYGEEMKQGSLAAPILDSQGRSVTYDVYLTTVANSGGVTLSNVGTLPAVGAGTSITNLASIDAKTLTFSAATASVGGKLSVKFNLRKFVGGVSTPADDAVSSVTKSMEVVNPAVNKLTYSVNTINTLFNTLDNGTYGSTIDNTKPQTDITSVISGGTLSALGRGVSLKAVDSSGDTVAVPSSTVLSVTSSNTKIIKTAGRYVIGNQAGTASLSVLYTDKADGSVKTLFSDVTVKSDAISIASLSAATTVFTASVTPVSANVYNAFDLMTDAVTTLTAKDQYSNTFDTVSEFVDYKQLTGIVFAASNVKGGGSVTVSTDNKVTITGAVTSFTISAIAPNGKTVSTSVVVN